MEVEAYSRLRKRLRVQEVNSIKHALEAGSSPPLLERKKGRGGMKILSSQRVCNILYSLISIILTRLKTKAEHQPLLLFFQSEVAALTVQGKCGTYLTREVKQDSCKASQRGLHRLKQCLLLNTRTDGRVRCIFHCCSQIPDKERERFTLLEENEASGT